MSVELPPQDANRLHCWPRQRVFRLGLTMLLAGIVLAPLLAALGHTISHIVPLLGFVLQRVAPLGGLLTSVGGGVMIYSRLSMRNTPADGRFLAPARKPDVRPTQRQPLPEPRRQPVGSVTEATTRILTTPASTPAQQLPGWPDKSCFD